MRLRAALVVIELSLAVVLLTGAGLMIRSLFRVLSKPLGFRSERLLTMRISLPAAQYPTGPKQSEFFWEVLARLEALPGVEFAALINDPPLTSGNQTGSFSIEGRPEWRPEEEPLSEWRVASTDYFHALGVPLPRGRFFTDADASGSPPVVLINQQMAERFWPNEDPLGKRMNPKWGPNQGWRKIVSVVGNVKQSGFEQIASPETYIPYFQQPLSSMHIVIRTNGDPSALTASVRREVLGIDKNQPIYDVRTMEQRVRESTSSRRVSTLLFAFFGVLALTVAAVGIYGEMAYSATQRTHEIGIRIALGANTSDVFRLVVGQGMKMAAIGVAVGSVGALILNRLIASLLFEVRSTDPLTLLVVPLVMMLVALTACGVPAWRASRVDPVIAMHNE